MKNNLQLQEAVNRPIFMIAALSVMKSICVTKYQNKVNIVYLLYNECESEYIIFHTSIETFFFIDLRIPSKKCIVIRVHAETWVDLTV